MNPILDTLENIQAFMRKEFNIARQAETRLRVKHSCDTSELLANLSLTVQDSGLSSGQLIIIEVKDKDGSWPRQFSRINVKPSRIVNTLDANENTYRSVEGHFMRMGGTGSAIQSIDIVKNDALEEAFQRKIREFKLKGIPLDVIFAYHGTPATNLDSILKDNFDLRKAKF